MWEGRSLRDIGEADIRRLIELGLAEHLELEYKSELYGGNLQGRKEFLLDVAMFANTNGGILIIGVSDLRDEHGQATGVPDPDAVLGLVIDNPERVLATYDASVTDSIEERLPLESAPVPVGEGRHVLVIRVPHSTKRPHSVRHEGHIYFPARRERQRYYMGVREIKEMVMRTASHLQQAEQLLDSVLDKETPRKVAPYLTMGIVPVFFEDFLVDVRAEAARKAVSVFSRVGGGGYENPYFTFNGLKGWDKRFDHTVTLRRSGLVTAKSELPLIPQQKDRNKQVVALTSFDVLLRAFTTQAGELYTAVKVEPPFVMGMFLSVPQQSLYGAYAGADGLEYHTQPLLPADFSFPHMQVDDLSDFGKIIRPLCDQAHQMFGREGSPSFDAEGRWIGRY